MAIRRGPTYGRTDWQSVLLAERLPSRVDEKVRLAVRIGAIIAWNAVAIFGLALVPVSADDGTLASDGLAAADVLTTGVATRSEPPRRRMCHAPVLCLAGPGPWDPHRSRVLRRVFHERARRNLHGRRYAVRRAVGSSVDARLRTAANTRTGQVLSARPEHARSGSDGRFRGRQNGAQQYRLLPQHHAGRRVLVGTRRAGRRGDPSAGEARCEPRVLFHGLGPRLHSIGVYAQSECEPAQLSSSSDGGGCPDAARSRRCNSKSESGTHWQPEEAGVFRARTRCW